MPKVGSVSCLTDEQRAEARRRYAAGATQRELARHFGVHQTTIGRALGGRQGSDENLGLQARVDELEAEVARLRRRDRVRGAK